MGGGVVMVVTAVYKMASCCSGLQLALADGWLCLKNMPVLSNIYIYIYMSKKDYSFV